MYKEYDFRIKEELDFSKEPPGTEDDELLKRLRQRLEEVERETKTYYSTEERQDFIRMSEVMKRIAFEQSAFLRIELYDDRGSFVLESDQFCFCDFLKIDQEFFGYLQSHTFIEPLEQGVQIKVLIPFVKRKRKGFLAGLRKPDMPI